MSTSRSSTMAEAQPGNNKQPEPEVKKGLFDKSLTTAANLSKLLPTGTTMAFQTMAPSFTNHGRCYGLVNSCFTWGLIGFLSFLCALLSFTDSVTDDNGYTYYGLATPWGFKLFNHDLGMFAKDAKEREELEKRLKLRPRDFLHAVLSAGVFLALAFCDAGVQDCLVPKESDQWKEFLGNTPLAVSFLASFVFMIFPSDRNGIGDDGEVKKTTGQLKVDGPDAQLSKNKSNSCVSALTMDVTRVAPASTSYELDPVV